MVRNYLTDKQALLTTCELPFLKNVSEQVLPQILLVETSHEETKSQWEMSNFVSLNSSVVNAALNQRLWFRTNGYRHQPGGGLQTTRQAVQNEHSHRRASE